MKRLLMIVALLSPFIFTGCIQNIQNVSANGVTLRVSADELSSTLQDSFPVIQNFQYGSIELSDPKAILKKGSDRMITGTTIAYSNDLIPEQKGSLYISGSPFFNAQTGEIFLKAPKIEKMEFNGYNLFDYVQKPLIDALQPAINSLFAQNPIYRVDRSSIQSSFIKNVTVSDGALLVTFGL
jgi:hypothetical protein